MLWLNVSTSRSDRPRRSRSALSRFPHSGFHDEAHIRRPIPKESLDVNPNTPTFNKFLDCFRKAGQDGQYLVVIPATNGSCFSWRHAYMCLFYLGESEYLAEGWDSVKIVVAITAYGYLYE